MAELEKLARAVKSLSKNIADFPLGAISLHDLKPTEEKIEDLRNSFKRLNARILMLRAQDEAQKTSDVFEETVEETYQNLQDEITSRIIDNRGIHLCLHNSAMTDIFENSDYKELHNTIKTIMKSLYILNDSIIGLNQTRTEQLSKEAELTHQLQEALLEYSEFLKQQEGIRSKKLQETNPEIASKKKKMQKSLQKINIMKRLIMNFIGSSSNIIRLNPFLDEMVRNHRELVDIETIVNMSLEKRTEES